MKKIIALCTLAITLCLQGFAQNGLEKIILDSKLEILVPTGFTRMKRKMFTTYSSVDKRKPSWAITYDNGKVVLSCTFTEKKVDDNSIPAFTDQLIAELKASKNDFKLADDGILLQDGKNIGYIKFMSRVKAQKIFNYMFYNSLEERLVLFILECPKKLREKWEVKADEMAASLRLQNL